MWLRIRKILRQLLFRRRVEQELEDELSFHLAMETEARLRAGGISEGEARRAAHVAFGGVERYREQVRQARTVALLDDLLADVRLSFRSIVRYRTFSLAVILTLALGIGGTTAIFSVVDGLFLRTPEGVLGAEDVRRIYVVRDEGNVTTREGGPGSYLDYEALARASELEDVSAFISRQVEIGRGEEAQQVRAAAVTASHFGVLGVRPAIGRFFRAEEDRVQGEHPVAVISHALWQREFGGAAGVLGQRIIVNGQPLTIIGVTQRRFSGITPDPLDVWVPAAMAGPLALFGFSSERDWRTMSGMAAIDYVARVAGGITEEQATAGAASALTRAAEAHSGLDPTPGAILTKLTAAGGPFENRAAKLSLWLALVAGVVLIMSCVNVANLLLARAVARRRELAVRLALGAGRSRIVRQNLTESIVLGVLGGAAGLLVTYWSMGIIRQFPLPPWAGRLDMRLLLFALGISILTGLLFGMLPALRSVRVDPLRGMQDTRLSPEVSRSGTRRALAAVQVALSVVLLIGAALFVRSLRAVHDIDPGVALEELVVVDIDLDRAGFSPADKEEFWGVARDRLSRVAAVENTALVHFAPFVRMSLGRPWRVRGQEPVQFAEGPHYNLAGPGYFEAAGVRVLEGREFTAADRTGEPTVVINRALAEGIAPGGSALGLCLQFGREADADSCSRVIGVVENYRTALLEEERVPMIFAPRDRNASDISWGGPSLVVRTRGNADEHAAVVRAAIQSLRADLPFVRAQPMAEMVRDELLPFRLGATLFTTFGLLALLLAGVGLYGVLGYFVTERVHEIGIRRSLGASVQSVVGLVLWQGLVPVAVGLAVGLGVALAGTRFVGSLLFGVAPTDAVSVLVAALFLLVTAVIAVLLPARRAAAIDPMVALRQD